MLIPRPIFPFVLLVAVFAARALHAQPKLGRVVGSFPFGASRLLADPVRPRVYAAVPATNSVAVIDTHSLQIIANVFIGANPQDLAIAPDGNTLYTVNGGSTSAAIGVLDLNTLQTRPALALPGVGYSIAAGLDGRLYVSTIDPSDALYQVDSATGVVQDTLDTANFEVGHLQISPDRQTLYSGSSGVIRYDVSSSLALLLQSSGSPNERDGDSLTLGHTGKLICLLGEYNESIELLYTENLATSPGTLKVGGFTGPVAFSPDDSLVYASPPFSDEQSLGVYSTRTFAKVAEVQIPAPSTSELVDYQVLDLVTDSTGSFLFVSQQSENAGGSIVAITTGAGPLLPPDETLPVVRIQSDTPQVYNSLFQQGHFTLTRTGDLSQPLTVYYYIGGTADDGVDYEGLSGMKTFKAGRASAGIVLVPTPIYGGDRGGSVKLHIDTNTFYNIGTAKAKLVIIP